MKIVKKGNFEQISKKLRDITRETLRNLCGNLEKIMGQFRKTLWHVKHEGEIHRKYDFS